MKPVLGKLVFDNGNHSYQLWVTYTDCVFVSHIKNEKVSEDL